MGPLRLLIAFLALLVAANWKKETSLVEGASFPWVILNLTNKEITFLQDTKFFEQAKDEVWAESPNGDVALDRTLTSSYHNPQEGRIIGGSDVRPNEQPWTVAIFTQSGSKSITCAGTLVSSQHVLTAAQCVTGFSRVSVVLGVIDHNNPGSGQVYEAAKIVIHPKWNSQTKMGDVAVILLPVIVSYTNAIRPISIAPPTESTHNGDTAIVSGWGQTSENSDVSSNLLKTSMTAISNLQCSLSYPNIITDGNICASNANGYGPCSGDVGGPLTYVRSDGTSVQIGITSLNGAPTCRNSLPAVFTRVSYYSDWISSQMAINTSKSPSTHQQLNLIVFFLGIVPWLFFHF